MKKLLFTLLLLASTTVFADRIDTIRQQDVAIYCQSEARAFYDGMNYKLAGTARKFINIDRAEYEKRSADEDPPLDGMYFIDWNKYTDQEKAFIVEHVLNGYDFMSDLEAKGVPFDRDEISQAAQMYYERCGQKEAARRAMKQTDSSMHRTASNQRLITPHSANSPQQEHCTDLAVQKYNSCMVGK